MEEGGCLVDGSGDGEGTPLYIAALNGYVEGVKLLLDAKANVDVADCDGWRPLHGAAAPLNYDLSCLKLLLDAKANVNVLDKDGNSPLHRAVTHGGLGIELLIHARANPDTPNHHGETPLAIAVVQRNRSCAATLLDAGAKLAKVRVKFPYWMVDLLNVRRNARRGVLTFIGVMRKRYVVSGAHHSNRMPRDVVNIVSAMLWEKRHYHSIWAK